MLVRRRGLGSEVFVKKNLYYGKYWEVAKILHEFIESRELNQVCKKHSITKPVKSLVSN